MNASRIISLSLTWVAHWLVTPIKKVENRRRGRWWAWFWIGWIGSACGVPKWTSGQLEIQVWSSRQIFRMEIKIWEISSSFWKSVALRELLTLRDCRVALWVGGGGGQCQVGKKIKEDLDGQIYWIWLLGGFWEIISDLLSFSWEYHLLRQVC